jgi:hypothetical protein
MSENDSTSVWSYFSQADEITFRSDQLFSEEPRGRPLRRAGEFDIHDQSMSGLLRDSVAACDRLDKSLGHEPERISGNDSDSDTLVSVASVSDASTLGPRVHFACLPKDIGMMLWDYPRLWLKLTWYHQRRFASPSAARVEPQAPTLEPVVRTPADLV